MLKISTAGPLQITLPSELIQANMYSFLSQAIDQRGDARASSIAFDFSKLETIGPVGVVVLSNLIEYLRLCKVSGTLTGLFDSQGMRYLDAAGFFERYKGNKLFYRQVHFDGLLPLKLVDGSMGGVTGYIYSSLIPWIALQVGRSEQSLSVVRVCLEEIFQNIIDHAGTYVGCVSAQNMAHRGQLEVVISDFGVGIPDMVRSKRPEFVSDSSALRKACERGFSTGSNVRNRGWGLPTLLEHVTGRALGRVWIVSGSGDVSALALQTGPKITARGRGSRYPGTMIRIILDHKSILELDKAVAKEEFSW